MLPWTMSVGLLLGIWVTVKLPLVSTEGYSPVMMELPVAPPVALAPALPTALTSPPLKAPGTRLDQGRVLAPVHVGVLPLVDGIV